jgi:hypothetical protein
MPPRRRAERDPREPLVRLVERLSQRRQFVTLADLERAAARSSRLPHDGLVALVDEAVAESILLKDRRTFFDRTSGECSDHWVYRVNPRHSLVAEILGAGEP